MQTTTAGQFAEKMKVPQPAANVFLQFLVKRGAAKIVEQLPSAGGKGRKANLFEIPDLTPSGTQELCTADFSQKHGLEKANASAVMNFITSSGIGKNSRIVPREGRPGLYMYEVPTKLGEFEL